MSNRSVERDYDTFTSTRGGVEIVSSDGEFSATMGGRLLLDAAYYDEDKNSLGNGTEIRSARLDMEGRIFADIIYELSVDFADGDADMKDAWLAYDAHHPWRFILGHFKEPFSLEELTSRKHLTFMERALPNALVPGRNMGLGLQWRGEQVSVAAGLFGDDFNDDSDDEGDEGWGVSTRATYAPIASERSAVHFGASAAHRKLDDEEEYRVDIRPESHLTDVRYLDTGKIKQSRTLTLVGLETAWVYGETSLQAEWLASNLERDDDTDIEFSGWYVQASWFPTGESRHYKHQQARFGRVKPFSELGALELALRYSTLDLTDQDVEGGSSDQITVGVNWYYKPQMRFMMNYSLVKNDRYADADGDLENEDEPKILQLRAQVDF
ncbi:MAG: porin [Candidatus Thiodiazotropha lotti]|nr:porin [Candidatus Thiodiazotropha lotti]